MFAQKETMPAPPTIQVCLSPLLFPSIQKSKETVIVVIDLIRATTSMVAALDTGVAGIWPAGSPEEALSWNLEHVVRAGERDSLKLDGFDLGNSPGEFLNPLLKGKNLVMTTTNGTEAIRVAKEAGLVLLASLHNLVAVCNHLTGLKRDVVFLCSGWKGEVSIEDALLAGKGSSLLAETGHYQITQDAALLCMNLARQAGDSWYSFILAHSPRLNGKTGWMDDDIRFCLSNRESHAIPILKGSVIRNLADSSL